MAKTVKDFKSVVAVDYTLTYTDTTAVKLFPLPRNAEIVQVIANVKTAFTNQELDIGIASDADAIADGIPLSGIQQGTHGGEIVSPGYKNTTNNAVMIYGVIVDTGVAGSAGEVSLTVLLKLRQHSTFG